MILLHSHEYTAIHHVLTPKNNGTLFLTLSFGSINRTDYLLSPV